MGTTKKRGCLSLAGVKSYARKFLPIYPAASEIIAVRKLKRIVQTLYSGKSWAMLQKRVVQ